MSWQMSLRTPAIPADPDVKNYSYTLVDDRVYYRENSIMKPFRYVSFHAGTYQGNGGYPKLYTGAYQSTIRGISGYGN